jgi:putative colanic acid biosynthesis UDP-glucose lipid carrier transferase
VSTQGTSTAGWKATTVERPAGGLIRPYHRELALLGRATDLLWVGSSLWISMSLVGYDWKEPYTLLAAVGCVLFYLSAEAFSIYNDRRSAPLGADLGAIVGAWTVAAIGVMFLGYAFKVTDYYSRLAVSGWFLLAPTLLVTWRVLVRTGLTKVRALGYNTRRVAIVGAGDQGLRVARTVLHAPWMGLRLVGIFDDRAPVPGRIPDELPCKLLGNTRDLLTQVRREAVDMVYVTLPINNRERIVSLLDALSDTTVSLYIVPDMFLFSMLHGRWVRIHDVPAVSVFESPFYGVDGWIKRVEDVVIATMVLAVAAIPMACIALAVRLTSRGPVLFKQRRYGLDGREFQIWKFRTMTVSDDDDQVPQAVQRDPRVTKVGAFLRRTSLDELPQFFNVLAGTMSVVGPRPHARVHNEYYRALIRGYMVRHKVRPGITGWAQANGWRGETETIDKMETRVEYDLWYIRNWSVPLDLKIIAMTVPRFWRDGNAY